MHIWPGNCHNQISSKCLIARTSKWGEIAGWHSSRVVTKISAAPTADLVPNRTDSLPLCRGLSPFLTPSRPFPLNLACSRSHAHPHCHTPVLSRTPSISRALWLTTTRTHLHTFIVHDPIQTVPNDGRDNCRNTEDWAHLFRAVGAEAVSVQLGEGTQARHQLLLHFGVWHGVLSLCPRRHCKFRSSKVTNPRTLNSRLLWNRPPFLVKRGRQ